MTDPQRAPGPAVHFLARAALLSTNLIICLGLFAIGPALPAVRNAFITSPGVETIVPLIGSAAGFAFALMSLFVAAPINRYGFRSVLLAGLVVFSIAALSVVVLPYLYMLLASRFVVGIASAFIVNASVAAVGTLFPPVERARLMGIQTLFGSIAAIILFPLSGALSGIDWRWAIALDSFAILLLPAMLLLPSAAAAKAVVHDAAPDAAIRPDPLALLSASLTGVVIFLTAVFGALYLSLLGLHDAAELSIPSTAAAVGSLLGSSSYVLFSHRLGIDQAFVLGLLLIGLGLGAAGLSTSAVPFALGIGLASIGTGMFLPNLNAAAVRSAPLRPAAAVGFANATLYGSMVIFPALVLPLARDAEHVSGAIQVVAVAALMAAVGFLGRARFATAPGQTRRPVRSNDIGGHYD